MITIYTLAYNEEVLIKFMIDHYRSRFPDCKIIVYDNMSTDKTKNIALRNNCTVIPYHSNDKLNDQIYLQIKNNCWKQAKTNWVLICDVDELLNINENDLKKEEKRGGTIIRSEGYNMVNMRDDFNIAGINRGMRAPGYDKKMLFNKQFISDIKYDIGCHTCYPIGTKIIESIKSYPMYHYKYINSKYQIDRMELFASRLSNFNIAHKIGMEYKITPLQIKFDYFTFRGQAIKLF